jgi:hypothetical protein
MGYKVKYTRKEKKEKKENKKDKPDIDILNLPPNFWIDARDIFNDYVYI